MITLRKQVEEINDQFKCENQKLIEILSNLKRKEVVTLWTQQDDPCISKNNSKNSIVSTPFGKTNKTTLSSKKLSSSVHSIKNSRSYLTKDNFQRCQSCKLINRSKIKQKSLNKSKKMFQELSKRDLKILKLKKLSDKIIPKIASYTSNCKKGLSKMSIMSKRLKQAEN